MLSCWRALEGSRIVDMQHDIAGLVAGMQLEPQTDPAVRLICSGVIGCRDGIDKRKEARARATTFVQFVDELGPFVIQHGLEASFET